MTVGNPTTSTLDQAKGHIGLRYNCLSAYPPSKSFISDAYPSTLETTQYLKCSSSTPYRAAH